VVTMNVGSRAPACPLLLLRCARGGPLPYTACAPDHVVRKVISGSGNRSDPPPHWELPVAIDGLVFLLAYSLSLCVGVSEEEVVGAAARGEPVQAAAGGLECDLDIKESALRTKWQVVLTRPLPVPPPPEHKVHIAAFIHCKRSPILLHHNTHCFTQTEQCKTPAVFIQGTELL
jgi:hypothetical protein